MPDQGQLGSIDWITNESYLDQVVNCLGVASKVPAIAVSAWTRSLRGAEKRGTLLCLDTELG
jgi:hypothetical protein